MMKLPRKARVCGCRNCGLVFTTVRSFDRHRVGPYDISKPGFGRRCLTEAELTDKGMVQDARGRWHRTGPANAFMLSVRRKGGRPILSDRINPVPDSGFPAGAANRVPLS